MFENIENMMPNTSNPVMVQLNPRIDNSIPSPSPTRMMKTNFNMSNIEKSKFLPNLNRFSPISKANSPGLMDLPVLHIESECK